MPGGWRAAPLWVTSLRWGSGPPRCLGLRAQPSPRVATRGRCGPARTGPAGTTVARSPPAAVSELLPPAGSKGKVSGQGKMAGSCPEAPPHAGLFTGCWGRGSWMGSTPG